MTRNGSWLLVGVAAMIAVLIGTAAPAAPLTPGKTYRPDKMGPDTIHHDAEHPSQPILPAMAGD